MAAEHDELVAEMASVARMTVEERLLLAKMRRSEQLKSWTEAPTTTTTTTTTTTRKRTRKNPSKDNSNVKFDCKTRLFEAASRNDVDEVRTLLRSGQCLSNASNEDGFTVLHQCCIDGHENLIRTLIKDYGADVNQSDNELWTPLHTVSLCGRAQLSKLLIENGGDLLALNIDGNMPYDICEDEETLDIIELEMSKRGVTQEQIEDLRLTKERRMFDDMQLILRDGGDLETRGIYGETPLHVSAANGYITVAKLLLDANVTVDAEDNDFWQPIHCAARWRQLPVLELLIIHGSSLTSATEDGRTPLDLCDDQDIQSWMMELKEEMESKTASVTTSHNRLLNIIASKNSLQQQTGSSTIYSSNISLSEMNKVSSSNRRLTTSEKERITKKEMHEESKLRGSLQSLIDVAKTERTSSSNRKSDGDDDDDDVAPTENRNDESRTSSTAAAESRSAVNGGNGSHPINTGETNRGRGVGVGADKERSSEISFDAAPIRNGLSNNNNNNNNININGQTSVVLPKSCLKKTNSNSVPVDNGHQIDVSTNERNGIKAAGGGNHRNGSVASNHLRSSPGKSVSRFECCLVS